MINLKTFFVCIGLTFLAAGNAQANSAEELFDLGYEAFVKRDYVTAESYWKRAGALDHVRAQNGLGIMYRDGDLGEPRSEDAAIWFTKSANNGYAFAMFNLGMLYKTGVISESSDIVAYRWLVLANTINFDENAKFQANLLSQRMDQRSIIIAREQAQLWVDDFFYGVAKKR